MGLFNSGLSVCYSRFKAAGADHVQRWFVLLNGTSYTVRCEELQVAL